MARRRMSLRRSIKRCDLGLTFRRLQAAGGVDRADRPASPIRSRGRAVRLWISAISAIWRGPMRWSTSGWRRKMPVALHGRIEQDRVDRLGGRPAHEIGADDFGREAGARDGLGRVAQDAAPTDRRTSPASPPPPAASSCRRARRRGPARAGLRPDRARASIADCPAAPGHRPTFIALAREVEGVAVSSGVKLESFDGFDPAAFMPEASLAAAEAPLDEQVVHKFAEIGQDPCPQIWRDLAVRKRKTEVDAQVGPDRRDRRRKGHPDAAHQAADRADPRHRGRQAACSPGKRSMRSRQVRPA